MFNLKGLKFPKITFCVSDLSTNSLATIFLQMSSIQSLCKLDNILLFMLLLGGGGGGLSVSIFEICEEPWVPFWENIAKLLEGRFRINKLNVLLEMKG